jgi:hypothetical protein
MDVLPRLLLEMFAETGVVGRTAEQYGALQAAQMGTMWHNQIRIDFFTCHLMRTNPTA